MLHTSIQLMKNNWNTTRKTNILHLDSSLLRHDALCFGIEGISKMLGQILEWVHHTKTSKIIHINISLQIFTFQGSVPTFSRPQSIFPKSKKRIFKHTQNGWIHYWFLQTDLSKQAEIYQLSNRSVTRVARTYWSSKPTLVWFYLCGFYTYT
jgi:hypothetical protein